MSFHVGQRVVCVKTPECDLDGVALPTRGTVYTVRHVYPHDHPSNICGKAIILLFEIDNAHLIGAVFFSSSHGRNVLLAGECGWTDEYFRPLDERRLDQFRAHLAPTPKTPVPA